jgi:nitrogen fixation protein NifU and related proteins
MFWPAFVFNLCVGLLLAAYLLRGVRRFERRADAIMAKLDRWHADELGKFDIARDEIKASLRAQVDAAIAEMEAKHAAPSESCPAIAGTGELAFSERIQLSDETTVDHFNNPHNIGSFDAADPTVGTGRVGAPESGDVMKLQIKVNPETGSIEDAKFKTFGCGAAVASGSLATEWLKGKTVEEALRITSTEIVKELALPPAKVHCSLLTEDAIKAAVKNYQDKSPDEPAAAEGE